MDELTVLYLSLTIKSTKILLGTNFKRRLINRSRKKSLTEPVHPESADNSM
jgi:hypothetical protein